MKAVLAAQKAANIRVGAPSAELRMERIERCIQLLKKHEAAIVSALNADFGNRPRGRQRRHRRRRLVGPLKHAKANVKAWMRPERRETTPALLGLLGAKAEIRYQPKGVVGVISPWNFPVNLTFAPLAGILAAGNRAMIKPSEFTPATSELMAQMFAERLRRGGDRRRSPAGPRWAQAFASLAFDHLVFTGATAIARHVMKAAAANLCR